MDRLESEVQDSGDKLSVSTGKTAQEEAVLPRDVYALLAQANLLRMRGHWEDAAQSCMAALRLAPDSSSANSLLGDIYENQGRYDDAAQWYRMALDANPDSPADRLKLDRLRQRGEPLRVQNSSAGGISPAQAVPNREQSHSPPELPMSRAKTLARDPEAILRYGAIAAALALILVVTSAYHVVHHAGPLSAFGIGGEAVVKSAPVIVPPVAGPLSSDLDVPALRDPSEQSLLTMLQASHDLTSLGITLFDVEVDPRTSRTTLTFGIPASPGRTQGEVSRDAFAVIQAAAASGQSSDLFTARCLVVSGASKSSATLAFVGDVSRDAIPAFAAPGAGLSDAQAEAVFSNVWWSSTADIRA